MMDASDDVTLTTWDEQKAFSKQLSAVFNVSATYTQVGILTYAGDIVEEVNLADTVDQATLDTA